MRTEEQGARSKEQGVNESSLAPGTLLLELSYTKNIFLKFHWEFKRCR